MGTAQSRDGREERRVVGGPVVVRPSTVDRMFFTRMTTLCDAGGPPPLPPLPGQTVGVADATKSAAPPPPPPPKPAADAAAAAASDPPPPPPPSASGSGEADSIAAAASTASAYSNPGPYEQAAMDGKRLVMLDCYDGFRCDVNKQLSPYMAVVHSFWLGTTQIPDGRKSTYTFLTQVADEQGLLMARVDPGRGALDGRAHRAVLGGLAMAKIQSAVSVSGETDQLLAEVDLGGNTWTANVKYGSMGGGLVYGCNYLQQITPRWTAGGEGMYLAAHQNALANYTIKYTCPALTGEEDAPKPAHRPAAAQPPAPGAPPGPGAGGLDGPGGGGSSTLCLNYNSGQAAVTANYRRVVTPGRVTLGAELTWSPATLDAACVLGAEFQLLRSKLNLTVDGNLKMQSLLEAKLGHQPGSPALTFSADCDHINQEYKFGYGINIGG